MADDHEAWAASVQARFDEALSHLAHGLPAVPLAELPCAKYPHCDQILGGGWSGDWPILPPGYEVVSVSDPMWTTDLVHWHVGELPRS